MDLQGTQINGPPTPPSPYVNWDKSHYDRHFGGPGRSPQDLDLWYEETEVRILFLQHGLEAILLNPQAVQHARPQGPSPRGLSRLVFVSYLEVRVCLQVGFSLGYGHPEVDRIQGMSGICHGSLKNDILSTPGWLLQL